MRGVKGEVFKRGLLDRERRAEGEAVAHLGHQQLLDLRGGDALAHDLDVDLPANGVEGEGEGGDEGEDEGEGGGGGEGL